MPVLPENLFNRIASLESSVVPGVDQLAVTIRARSPLGGEILGNPADKSIILYVYTVVRVGGSHAG